MKFLLICALGLLISQNLVAQPQNKIDSLLKALNTAQDDTNKVNILLSLSTRHLQMSRLEVSIKYAEQALALAKHLGHKKQIASAYSLIGSNTGGLGNFSEGQKFQQMSLSISREIGDSSGIARAYHLIGANYKSQGRFDEALEYQLKSLTLREKLGNKSEIAVCYNEIGTIYEHQSNFVEALQNHFTALQIHEEEDNAHGVAMSHNHIGLIYKKQGYFVNAVKYYMSAIRISEENGDQQSLGRAYANLGNVYAAQRNFNEALKYHQAFLHLTGARGSKTGLSIAYLNIGEDYIGLQQFDRALDTLLLAKQICEEIGNNVRLASCLRSIGIIRMHENNPAEAIKNYLASLALARERNNKMEIALTSCDLGKAYLRSNQPTEAKLHLMNGLSLAIELGIKSTVKNAYEALSRLEAEQGNYQQALVYYQLYTEFKDDILNEETERQISILKEQYESEKKDKEILLLRGENSILEHAQRIQTLLIQTKQDSLNIANTEKEKAQLENEKFHALNLFHQQQLEMLGNEKRLQELQSEKDKSDLAFQKAESDKKQEQLALLNKEKVIRELELKKEKLTKNYFIGGLGLFMFLSFFIYKNYHTRQELKLLKLRNKIAIDLHDDVGSTLSSISIFSQMAQAQSKEVNPALETIGESSRKMLDAMADIVWTIKPENDQFEKVIMRMRGFAFELLGAKQIDFEFDADDAIAKINLPMESRKNLYLIFKEATNNMVKYSEASRAKFSLKGEKDKLMMFISDNGKGFDTTKAYNGNGLENMKKRAFDMGAQLFIDSTTGTGTTIKLELAV